MNTLRTHLARPFYPLLGLLVLLALSACSGASTTSAPPPAWKNYQSQLFTMSYLSNWQITTKDLYLGTRYPQLEMLNGMAFTRQGGATTFLQVTYATKTASAVSAKDIMLKFLLGSAAHPAAAASLSTTTLDGASWYQGTAEKQASQPDGSTVTVKETVLGIDHATSAGGAEIYLIVYQDAVNTYGQTERDFFQRMVTSFHFA